MAERRFDPRGTPAAAIVGLAAAIALFWGLMVWPILNMHSEPAHLMMPMSGTWTASNLATVFVMWAVMMAAMMMPGAQRMTLVYHHLLRRSDPAVAGRRTSIFVLAYLGAWALFSVAATGAQWSLQSAVLLTPMGASTSHWLTAVLFIVAGIYQFTPLKKACLTGCRSPLGFLTAAWRPGNRGAFIMGMRHGAICVGCCWALMALAFVGGTMNLAWMATLAAVVTVEKLVARGEAFDRFLGGVLLIGGLAYGTMLI
ncbi:MAG: DUF2182 domain-containing protein [Rhodospirillales bacterium]|nr:DUF2182 domain-containing protein [Rhodospirillales bacterium]